MKFLQEIISEDKKNIVFESTLLPSPATFRRFSLRDVTNIVHLYMITLEILRKEPEFAPMVREYINKTIRLRGFENFRPGQTDLYVLMHILTNDEARQKLRITPSTTKIEQRLRIDANAFINYLRRVSRDTVTYSMSNRYIFQLEKDLHIQNMSYRALRRMAVDWQRMTHQQKAMATTRLLQAWRANAFRAEILPYLQALGQKQNLILKGVSNAEKGETKKDKKHPKSRSLGYISPPNADGDRKPIDATRRRKQNDGPSPGLSFLRHLAMFGAGTAAGYGASRMLNEKNYTDDEIDELEYETGLTIYRPEIHDNMFFLRHGDFGKSSACFLNQNPDEGGRMFEDGVSVFKAIPQNNGYILIWPSQKNASYGIRDYSQDFIKSRKNINNGWFLIKGTPVTTQIKGLKLRAISFGSDGEYLLDTCKKIIKRPIDISKIFVDGHGEITLYDAIQKIKGLQEYATVGGTSAGSVAAIPGALGAGFDPDGDYGIYPKPRKKKQKKKKNEKGLMLRRPKPTNLIV